MKVRMKELCKEKGITQKELAKRLGVTDIWLRAALKGNPTLSTLLRVSEALDVEVAELFAPKCTFSAFVYDNGDVRHFTSKEELKAYIGQEK